MEEFNTCAIKNSFGGIKDANANVHANRKTLVRLNVPCNLKLFMELQPRSC